MTNINTTPGSSGQAPPSQFSSRFSSRFSPQLPTYYNQQRGTALLVAMVLMFVMTILGMSSLRETFLERRMTTNAVQKSIAFQLAESAASRVSQDTANLDAAFTANGQSVERLSETTDKGMEVKGHIIYIGKTSSLGSSLGSNLGFKTELFEVRGESRHVDAQVSSTVRLGIQRRILSN